MLSFANAGISSEAWASYASVYSAHLREMSLNLKAI